MKNKLKDFHHYKGNELTPSEKVERKVVEILLTSSLPDAKRESSVIWELKHSSGCCQIGRILAEKRKLNITICEVASLIHDIYSIVQGKYKEHAKLGAPIAEKILKEIGGFSEEEIAIITQAVAHHSEKEIYSDNPYIELVKDVDVFDCSLYKGAEGFYKIHKSEDVFREDVNRIRKVREELGLPVDNIFR